MKKSVYLIVINLFLFVTSSLLAAEKASPKIIDLANSKLIKWGSDPVIVSAVKGENAKNKTLDQIKEMDKKWMDTAGVDGFMKSLMESPCGKHLQTLQKTSPYYAEIFVMDSQGANVCMSDKTSDYWQGDEAKFIESYKGGVGAVQFSDVGFDKSTQAYLVQVSVPVKDAGKVIGAVTIGINVDKFK
jgi:hypothetical protein